MQKFELYVILVFFLSACDVHTPAQKSNSKTSSSDKSQLSLVGTGEGTVKYDKIEFMGGIPVPPPPSNDEAAVCPAILLCGLNPGPQPPKHDQYDSFCGNYDMKPSYDPIIMVDMSANSCSMETLKSKLKSVFDNKVPEDCQGVSPVVISSHGKIKESKYITFDSIEVQNFCSEDDKPLFNLIAIGPRIEVKKTTTIECGGDMIPFEDIAQSINDAAKESVSKPNLTVFVDTCHAGATTGVCDDLPFVGSIITSSDSQEVGNKAFQSFLDKAYSHCLAGGFGKDKEVDLKELCTFAETKHRLDGLKTMCAGENKYLFSCHQQAQCNTAPSDVETSTSNETSESDESAAEGQMYNDD